LHDYDILCEGERREDVIVCGRYMRVWSNGNDRALFFSHPLLFSERKTNATLLASIDLVFEDLEKGTGHRVVECVFNCDW
jgi:hypothetical protein